MDPGVDIGHVHLKTADVGRVRRFYIDIFDLDGSPAHRRATMAPMQPRNPPPTTPANKPATTFTADLPATT